MYKPHGPTCNLVQRPIPSLILTAAFGTVAFEYGVLFVQRTATDVVRALIGGGICILQVLVRLGAVAKPLAICDIPSMYSYPTIILVVEKWWLGRARKREMCQAAAMRTYQVAKAKLFVS